MGKLVLNQCLKGSLPQRSHIRIGLRPRMNTSEREREMKREGMIEIGKRGDGERDRDKERRDLE